MVKDPERVKLDQIDWAATFPFVRIFESFRMAIWPPGKLLLALLLIVLLWIGGGLLDAMVGQRVQPGEIEAFAREESREAFDEWRERQERTVRNRLLGISIDLPTPGEEQVWRDLVEQADRFTVIRQAIADHYAARHEQLDERYREASREEGLQERERQAGVRELTAPTMTREDYETRQADIERQRRDRLASLAALESSGIFAASLRYKLDAFERLIASVIGLNFGFGQLASPEPLHGDTVLGALRELVVVLPSWLLHRHPVVLAVWCLFVMALWSLFGGAISRMCAVHATRQEPASAGEALRFARKRWVWYFMTPLIPLAIAVACGLVVAVVGVLFNMALLNIVGGAMYGLLLMLGLLIAMAIIFVAIGSGLFYPAIAVEGTDSFDALTRSGSYVFGRFWHWFFYTLVAMIHGAAMYLLLGVVVFLTLTVTRFFAGSMVVASMDDGRNVFDVMLPVPELGKLTSAVEWSELGVTQVASAGLVAIWVYLIIGVLAAFAICYYVAAHTWIYLLLRRSADGTELDEVYADDDAPDAEPALPEPQTVEAS